MEDPTVSALAAATPKIHETFYKILQNETIKRYSNELIKPITNKVYNFLYPYVWFICIYNILVFLLLLANFILLLHIAFSRKKTPHNV
jgi:hypothetical protein